MPPPPPPTTPTIYYGSFLHHPLPHRPSCYEVLLQHIVFVNERGIIVDVRSTTEPQQDLADVPGLPELVRELVRAGKVGDGGGGGGGGAQEWEDWERWDVVGGRGDGTREEGGGRRMARWFAPGFVGG